MKKFLCSKKGCVITGALVLLIVLGGAFAYYKSCSWEDRYEHHGQQVIGMMGKQLDLSDEQRARIEAVVNRTIQDIRDVRLRSRDEVKSLITRQRISPAQVRVAMDTRKNIREQTRDIIAASVAEVHGVLTPEQREKLAAHAHRFPGMGKRRGWGHGWVHGRGDWGH